MERDTLLTETLKGSDGKKMYDAICKKLLSHKMILAWVMEGCATEYKGSQVEDIAKKYIEGVPDVRRGNVTTGENIQGISNDIEGAVNYDIRFNSIAPKEGWYVGLIINMEAQNEFYLKYPLVTRGIYYVCRTISDQYGTVFSHSEYGKINKVYSIWICRDVPKYRENTITSYEFTQTNHVGEVKEKKEHYDLVSVVMICLGQAKDEPSSNVLRLLNTLFSEEVSAEEKIDFLEREFGIPRTEEFEEDIRNMCNFSQGIKQAGREEGIIETAKNALKAGLSEAVIKQITGLDLTTISQLKSELGGNSYV